MYQYTYDEFKKDFVPFAKRIKDEFNPDAFVGVARGGLTLTHALATALKSRNAYILNSIHYDGQKKLDTIEITNIPDLSNAKKVLLIDDIVDSGESLDAIKKKILKLYPHLDIKLAVVFYKPKAIIKPEFCIKEAKEWISFFWDFEE
ncbi:phosphoribosyltransferase [Campylobacter sp. MG1]|uniref:phosphoribosyltransferase n=1 Tax=Campylobacter sp. MG1 TaxID=2976332 RepID=UPI00226D33EC|nr:phosphoribosyltransferase family protein [Campylobacter sp. MG1]